MDLATLRAKHTALAPVLTERSRRLWAATEAQAIGYRGIAQVARATGTAASTIQRGLRELTSGEPLVGTRTRKAGGGRKRATALDPTLLRDLDALVEPTAPGDPGSPLRWTCLSARTLAVALDALSWGGLLTRAYFDQYPQEVGGLIFLDALNPGMTREERAKAAPPEEREQLLAPPTLPEIPPDTPPGLRAEYEVVGSEMVNDYPEARSLRLPSGVPIAVVVAAPPGRIKGSGTEGTLCRRRACRPSGSS